MQSWSHCRRHATRLFLHFLSWKVINTTVVSEVGVSDLLSSQSYFEKMKVAKSSSCPMLLSIHRSDQTTCQWTWNPYQLNATHFCMYQILSEAPHFAQKTMEIKRHMICILWIQVEISVYQIHMTSHQHTSNSQKKSWKNELSYQSVTDHFPSRIRSSSFYSAVHFCSLSVI